MAVKVKRADGQWTHKRGFTSPSAAATWRRRQLERVERHEVVHTVETFGEFWTRWLHRRKHYLAEGTWEAYERDGRLRLLPTLESISLGELDVDDVRELIGVDPLSRTVCQIKLYTKPGPLQWLW